MGNYNTKLYNKCQALHAILCGVRDYYEGASPDQKIFIETTIGAALWYLPKNKKLLFTGKISLDALAKNERSEDHFFPRKIAAREMLEDTRDTSATIIMESFLQKYGRYNYVSKSENKKLIKYQKSNTFLCPSESYKKAGVRLVDYEDCKKK